MLSNKTMTPATEISGVHDDVGAGWDGKLRLRLGFLEMAQNGLAAAAVGGGKLGGGLFACRSAIGIGD